MKIEVEKGQVSGQITFGDMGNNVNPIQVSIQQFYGIEINDFAVKVGMTSLWIAESQMMKETEDVIHMNLDFLPLKSYTNIVEGNALRMDWNEVISAYELHYIMGNPPFVGARLMNAEQKNDLNSIFAGWKNAGNMDYVSCWYKKSVDYIGKTTIKCALVSTNSISQGEQVANLWKPLFERGVHIDFAHRTFRWDSEASIKAHVHCVIVGFSVGSSTKEKIIYSGNEIRRASNINAYLTDGPSVYIAGRKTPICEVPTLVTGCQRLDNDCFMFNKEEMRDFIKQEPYSEKYFKRRYGAEEFINNKERYCL